MHVRIDLGSYSITHVYADRTPILSIMAQDSGHVTITAPDASTVTADDLVAVRALRRAVERFAAECERIAAADHPADTAVVGAATDGRAA